MTAALTTNYTVDDFLARFRRLEKDAELPDVLRGHKIIAGSEEAKLPVLIGEEDGIKGLDDVIEGVQTITAVAVGLISKTEGLRLGCDILDEYFCCRDELFKGWKYPDCSKIVSKLYDRLPHHSKVTLSKISYMLDGSPLLHSSEKDIIRWRRRQRVANTYLDFMDNISMKSLAVAGACAMVSYVGLLAFSALGKSSGFMNTLHTVAGSLGLAGMVAYSASRRIAFSIDNGASYYLPKVDRVLQYERAIFGSYFSAEGVKKLQQKASTARHVFGTFAQKAARSYSY